jgi:phosphatidate cytidylyltransferase
VNAATARPLARAERTAVWLRLASAAALAPPALACVWFGGVWFAALVIAAAAVMGWEWARLTGHSTAATTAVMILAAALPSLELARGNGDVALLLVVVGVIAVALSARGGSTTGWAAFGTAWIALPCLACLWLERGAGPAAVLWLFVTVWATDTGAFVAGRTIGGPRLAPAWSPNKTWAGVAGGLVAAAAVTWAAAWVVGATALALVPAGMLISLASQAGDLAESMAKRRFGVKDSSHLIPGHGGFLDRLDGMLAAAAMEWVLTYAAGASPLLWRA